VTTSHSPSTLDDLRDAVRSCPFAIAVGGGTKPALSAVPESFVRISTRQLSGIVEYEPTEYTITVRAGTPLAEVRDVLASQGQALPFDPPFARAGATVGGTVAAGLSGPGGYRHGPARDFLIGVRFVDSEGRMLSGGGKVVKNAAGFDLPKFLIGSAGRLGVLAELTFKVFPQSEATATFCIAADTPAIAAGWIQRLSGGAHDLDALDYEPHAGVVWGRIAGAATALELRLRQIERALDLAGNFTTCDPDEAEFFWNRQLDFGWAAADRWLAKMPIMPNDIDDLESLLARAGISRHYSLGGNVAWIAGTAENLPLLEKLGHPAVMLRDPSGGEDSPFIHAAFGPPAPIASLKSAFDPRGCFPRF
jgi:glycolate oxidase FAD binding subunit